MSVYYKVVCHDCKEQVDLAGHSDEHVQEVAGKWAMYKHPSHSIAVFNDVLGFDNEYDKLYDSTEGYEKVDLEESE